MMLRVLLLFHGEISIQITRGIGETASAASSEAQGAPVLVKLTASLVTDASCPSPVYKTVRTSLKDNKISQAQL